MCLYYLIKHIYIYIYIYACVCVWEREGGRERECERKSAKVFRGGGGGFLFY